MQNNQAVGGDALAVGASVVAAPLSAVSALFDLCGVLDSGGIVRELDGTIFLRTDRDPAKLVGQPLADTVFWEQNPDDGRSLAAAVSDAERGCETTIDILFRTTASENVPLRLVLCPIAGDAAGAILIAGREISDAVVADKNHGDQIQLLNAADNADIGLWRWDLAMNELFCTPKCRQILNLPDDEQLSVEAFLEAVHPDDRSSIREFIANIRAGDAAFSEEFRVQYDDGSIEWIAAEGKSFQTAGGKGRMLGAVRRITATKQAAIELEQLNEREKKARDEAVEANRAKDFFLAFVSHELRSPLNAILGWSKILLTKQVDEETRRNALETIERSARVQSKLIDDLVDSARVTSGKLRLEFRPTNLYDIVNAVFQAQTPAAASHNIALNFASDSDEISVYADAGRLQQVFGNLLSNAIKFTPDGGSVSIEITSKRDTVEVAVSDTGVGIEQAALPTIFKQFSQGEVAQGRRNPGLGLGLSIVSILVEKHGGKVRAESDGAGRGARFTVTLPISMTKPEQPVPPPPQIARPLAGISILIVEDDHDSREVLHLFLEQCGASTISKESAREARRFLSETKKLPDIIISDLAMPDEDGYTFIEQVRALPRQAGGKIPAAALSAFTTAESRSRARDAGFDRYLTKPFEPELLIKEILEMTRAAAVRG